MNDTSKPRAGRVIAALIVVGLAVALFVFREPLTAWFAGAPKHADGVATHAHDKSDDAIAHYTCPMHPSVKSETPGKCPLCGMDLTPVSKAQEREGVVTIPAARQQMIGVRTSAVKSAPMLQSIRATGRLTYDESTLVEVNLRVSGWIEKLFVNKTGQRVQKGQALFTLYSPELQAAQQDFLLALRSQPLAQPEGGGRGTALASAARQRLRLLDLSDAQIDAVAKSGRPLTHVTFPAPASGFVIEKSVIEGGSVQPGVSLFRIASLNKIWIEADVYEADFSHVRVGQAAKVALDYLAGRHYEAKVAYVYPSIDPQSRTGRIRLELGNQELELRPGMYATVLLESDLGPTLQVPTSAVVYTGPRRVVFVDLGEGRFRPQEVQLGAESNGAYAVLSGLREGDVVATSGVFLIAAEARISTAAEYWEGKEAADLSPQRVAPERPEHAQPAPAPAPRGEQTTAALYVCPMHPEVQSDKPGQCPKCGMALQLQARPEAP